MFQIAICLPDAAQRRVIRALCTEYFHGHVESPTFSASDRNSTTPPESADLVFLSAAGRRPNGIDTALAMRQKGSRSSIVFLASGPEYAMDAFRLSALQYLIPPVSILRMYETLDRALLRRRGPCIPVSTRQGIMQVLFSDIEYVECIDHTLHFHLTGRRTLRTTTLRIPLRTALAPILHDNRFYQPHRSYVINLDAVAMLTDTEFRMNSGTPVPIPRGRLAEARQTYVSAMRLRCMFYEEMYGRPPKG